MSFNGSSTTDKVLDGVDLTGKTAVVTGASGGLGLETVRALAVAGAHVVMAGRDEAKTAAAMASIRGEHPEASLSSVVVDLGSLASVADAATTVGTAHPKIELLINNAGVMACPLSYTSDGFETQFGTNHLGHFLFTNLLAESLLAAGTSGGTSGGVAAGARVVNLSSAGHTMGGIDLDDLGFERRGYDPFAAYGQSKTANILFSIGLDRRWSASGVRSVAVHPGGIHTDLGRHLTPETIAFLQKRLAERAVRAESGATAFQWKSIPQGAATSVWAATSADLDGRGGMYLEDCQIAEPQSADRPGVGVAGYALDPDTAERLWTTSERLVGREFRYAA